MQERVLSLAFISVCYIYTVWSEWTIPSALVLVEGPILTSLWILKSSGNPDFSLIPCLDPDHQGTICRTKRVICPRPFSALASLLRLKCKWVLQGGSLAYAPQLISQRPTNSHKLEAISAGFEWPS